MLVVTVAAVIVACLQNSAAEAGAQSQPFPITSFSLVSPL